MTKTSRTNRPLVLGSIMAAMFMVAIEATIVSTVMPQIVGDLGGLQLYAWVFSAFLLTQTATTVIFGKLADLFGRKPTLLFGIAIFLIGSVLCGFAWSMPSMIVFRLIQGVGAGAIQPISITIVGDLYAAEERGKIQGYLASVWGISAVVGPLAGGLIIQRLSWAWVFWINVPLGLIATAGFLAYLHEDIRREKRHIDAAGAALFTIAVTSLMIGLGAVGPQGSPQTLLAASAVFVVSAVLFLIQERRAPEPMIALRLWSQRSIAITNVATLLSGMIIIGLTTFLPMFVQGVLGQTPLVAGFALTMMVLGWPVAATVAARNIMKVGLRRTLIAGSLLMPLGALPMVLLADGSSPIVAGLGSLVVGCGMGLFSTAAIILIQESVGWSERGSATASNIFSRNLGNTLGATVLGGVLNAGLARAGGAASVTSEQLRHLLDASATDHDLAVRAVLQHALHTTFWALFVIAVLVVVASWLVPATTITRRPVPPGEPDTAVAQSLSE